MSEPLGPTDPIENVESGFPTDPSELEEPQDQDSPAAPGLRTFALELLGDVLKFALCFLFLYTFVFHVSVVKGSSMKPTFKDGDRLVVDTLTYRFTPIERFDVIVHENPHNHDEDFIKRVIGLPGDTIKVDRRGVMVNGTLIEEDYLSAKIRSYSYRGSKTSTVPEDSFFVLGDNRPASKDSRDLGAIPARLVKGKIRIRLWPISEFRVFTDRPYCLGLSLFGIGLFCFVGIPYLIRALGFS